MNSRHAVLFAALLVGCGGPAAPEPEPAPATSATTFAQPAPAPTTSADPSLSAGDAGLAPLPPVANPTPQPPLPVSDAGPIPCVPGGEVEVEPNETTPNELTVPRCGVLQPGDTVDVLRITKQTAFGIQWNGNVDVKLAQVPGQIGVFTATITSLTPAVATYWVVSFQ